MFRTAILVLLLVPMPVLAQDGWGRGELYFLDLDTDSPGVMAVEVSTSSGLQWSGAELLFRLPFRLDDPGPQFAAGDGQRFVVVGPAVLREATQEPAGR